MNKMEPIGCGWGVWPGSKRAPCNGGGGSSSSNQTSTFNIDKRLVVDSGVGISADSSNVSVTALDGGAIQEAFEFAGRNLDLLKHADELQGQASLQLLELAHSVFNRSFDVITENAEIVKAAGATVATAYDNAKGEGDAKRLVAYGVIAAVAIVAVRSFGKGAR